MPIAQRLPYHTPLIRRCLERIPSAEIDTADDKLNKEVVLQPLHHSLSSRSLASSSSSSSTVIKSVRFSESPPQIHPHVHYTEYSGPEFAASWYRKIELLHNMQEIPKTIRMHKEGEQLPEDRLTFRGLEYKTKHGAMVRRAIREAAMIAVLNEQARQRETDGYDGLLSILDDADEQQISSVYSKQAKESLVTAQRIGKEDEMESQRMERSSRIPRCIAQMARYCKFLP